MSPFPHLFYTYFLAGLLQHNLGGNSSTAMLITLHPAVKFVEQSLQTLRFAAKASSVRTVRCACISTLFTAV